MHWHDVKISTHLKVGLSAIVFLVALLGAVAWVQTDMLWQQTQGLFDHPLKVTRAVGEIRGEVLSMSRGMKSLLVSDADQERQTILQAMDLSEANVHRQFLILYNQYLGPRQDIEEAFTLFVQWETIRGETIQLLQAGRTAEAIRSTKSTGVAGDHAEKLLSHIEDVSQFAEKRADTFYLDAGKQSKSLSVLLAFMVSGICLLTAGVGYFLYLRIQRPLKELTRVIGHFQKGDLEVRSSNMSSNEYGIVAASFNHMAEAISVRIMVEEKRTALAEVLIRENELRKFADTVLEKFIEITESNMGVFYLRNADDGQFSPLAAVGVSPELLEPFDGATFEGQFGQTLQTGKVSHLKGIDQDTLFTFKTFTGTAIPREIITLPIMVNDEIRGMLALATIAGYGEIALDFMSQPSLVVLSTAFANLLAGDQTRLLAEALRENNQELQVQQEELQAQAEELRQQTEEIRTQNVELEQQRLTVEEASRLKSQFLSNMSHELRTPLNSVMALSRVLMMQARTKLSCEEVNYLEIIERNGKNLLILINDILDLAKIESGRMDIRPQSFSLHMTLENIVESLAPLAGEKALKIQTDIAEPLPQLENDEIRVSQILQNLIANAVKFTASGSVTVAAKVVGGKVLVSVADTGIGIAADDLPYIFDEFRQVDGSSSRRHEGTGLGLAIARKAARMLGGDIDVTSTLGLGSIFTLSLSLAWQGTALMAEPFVAWQPAEVQADRDLEHRQHVQGQELSKTSVSSRILLIEDNEAAIIQVKAVLESSGYTIDVARGGQEAVNFVTHTIPDGIVLDLMMPEVDGFAVLEQIRGRAATARIPVLILTAKDLTPADFKRLSANNIQQLVQKGDVDQESLLMKIKVML